MDSVKASTGSKVLDAIRDWTDRKVEEAPLFKAGLRGLADDPRRIAELDSVKDTIARYSLPGRVYKGEADPTSDESVAQSMGLAGGLATTGLAKAGLSKPIPDAEFGVFAGRRSSTADHKALAAAIEAEKKGVSADDILEGTSWYRGYDKLPRYEISDDTAKLNDRFTAVKDRNSAIYNNLSDVLDHPELFKAYPDMANMLVKIDPTLGRGQGVSYKPDHFYTEGMIGLAHPDSPLLPSEMRAGSSNSMNDSLSVLLHEIQHQIQAREGFVGGSSPDYVARQIGPAQLNARSKEGVPSDVLSQAIRNLYRRNAGEVEATQAQIRQDMTPAERRMFLPIDDLPPYIKKPSDVIIPFRDINQ